jgi:CheY-like chemotaxis protein
MASQILLVESEPDASASIGQLLASGGHTVTAVKSFEAASLPASRSRPDLLVTAVRLGRFNGLHLAVRFRADYPGLPIVVIGDETEVGLPAEARQLQARFLPRSTAPERMLAFIDDLLSGRMPRDLVSTRRWPRRPSALPAHVAQAEARIVDVGYGGLCLKCATPPAPADNPVDVSLPTVGMVVTGVCRWSRPADDVHSWLCGLELDTANIDTRKWRQVVDSTRES